MPFQHAIAGGQGNLIATSVQSPNFVTGISGWRVRKDGSAEFNNVTIRGGVVISGTELQYSPSPGFGNLIESSSPVTGTDAFGNAWLNGEVTYRHDAGGNPEALQKSGYSLTHYSAATAAGPWTADAEVDWRSGFVDFIADVQIGSVLRWIRPSGDTTGATDAASIQAALTAGMAVHLLPGTYWINAPLILRSANVLRGCGHGVTFIEIANAANCQAIQTFNFGSLTGTGSLGGVGQFHLAGLTLNGNSVNQSVRAAAAVQVYGYDYSIDDVDITGFLATDGLWTEYGPGGLPGLTGAEEARFTRLRIMENHLTGAGWRHRGPHDSHGFSILIAFNSDGGPPWPCTAFIAQQLAGKYTCGGTLITQMHCYGNHGVQYDLQDSVKFVNSVAEGASNTQLLIEAGDCTWADGWIFPGGPAGGNGIQLGTLANEGTGFIVTGTEIINFAGTSAATAAISVVNAGTGKIDVACFQPTGQAVWGSSGAQVDTRISYLQTNVPTLVADAGLGTGPPAPTVTHASDLRGTILMGTGTVPAAGDAATVTFAQPLVQSVPSVAVWAANKATAALAPYVDAVTATGFTVGFNVAPAASQASGTYQLGYAVTG